ncbi:Nitrogen permease regulator 2 [Pleurotus pulmonarius]|nr:Nitrogen permease regulator 2 [Pleurotus pulmonarius]
MPSDGDSFLPRIESVFYAVFDVKQGPKIVYQVPEGLIAPPPSLSNASVPPTPSSIDPLPATPFPGVESRNSSTSHMSPTDSRPGSYGLQSPQKRSTSLNRILFNFDDISKYVIPQPALCGRLVICSAQRYRIIGFPVNLQGEYERNYFTYNLCFVFARSADLSCYEPIVRKVSRVLTSCEEESGFLSDPQKSTALHGVLEQLYEELNSYSETSIPIDMFNSIELKIFPFYPNPPPVKDWMVPVALINLCRRIEPNWDLTIAKVCKHIDGVNHISKIAYLADCDIDLTRQAISHLLYYQVIMMIDIFQYSNMYTLRKTIQWLADESHVRDECGPYVTKPARTIPDWPQLLHLYSRLKPGKTVLQWIQDYDVEEMDIDVRRFTSFGVIKGFLRRVHRFPIFVPTTPQESMTSLLPASPSHTDETDSGTVHTPTLRFPNFARLRGAEIPPLQTGYIRGRGSHTSASTPKQDNSMVSPYGNGNDGPSHAEFAASAYPSESKQRPRRISAAERVLEQLRSRDRDLQRTPVANPNNSVLSHAPRMSWILPNKDEHSRHGSFHLADPSESHNERHRHPQAPPPSPVLSRASLTSTLSTSTGPTLSVAPARPRLSRSPSAPNVSALNIQSSCPPELVSLLDGEHHTDELCATFDVSWNTLEEWLRAIGAGQGDGEYGRVAVIYR